MQSSSISYSQQFLKQQPVPQQQEKYQPLNARISMILESKQTSLRSQSIDIKDLLSKRNTIHQIQQCEDSGQGI